VTTQRTGHLHLVTGDPAAAGRSTRAGVRSIAATTVGLTVVVSLLGGQAWALPHRDGGGVSAVPQSLLTFLLLCAAAGLWSAGRVVRPAQTFRSPDAARSWWVVVAAAAVIAVIADLSLASYAGTDQRPGGLLLRCAGTLVPALLGGVLARQDGPAARVRAALGTGVVTVPLLALGWALLASPAASPAGTPDVLAMTSLAGVAPLGLAAAFVAVDRRDRLPS
jgi:hypothetical protein